MATGTTLTDNKIEEIKALLTAGVSKNAIASRLKVSWATVDKYSKQEPDKLESLREDKKKDFIDKLWNNIVEAAELGHMMVTEAKEGKRDIPLGQVSTYLGTLYDKRALMNDEATANTKITVTLDKELESWAN